LVWPPRRRRAHGSSDRPATTEAAELFWHTLTVEAALAVQGYSILATYLVSGPDFMNRLVHTVSLDASQWLICVATALSIIVVSEVEKFFRRHGVRVVGATAG
jgi:cation transport ATPase-like protein